MNQMTRPQQYFLFRLARLARHLCNVQQRHIAPQSSRLSRPESARQPPLAGWTLVRQLPRFCSAASLLRVANALESPTELGWPFDLFIHNVPLGMELFSEIEAPDAHAAAFVAGLRRLGFYLPMPQHQ